MQASSSQDAGFAVLLTTAVKMTKGVEK